MQARIASPCIRAACTSPLSDTVPHCAPIGAMSPAHALRCSPSSSPLAPDPTDHTRVLASSEHFCSHPVDQLQAMRSQRQHWRLSSVVKALCGEARAAERCGGLEALTLMGAQSVNGSSRGAGGGERLPLASAASPPKLLDQYFNLRYPVAWHSDPK